MENTIENATEFFTEEVGSNVALGYKPLHTPSIPEILVKWANKTNTISDDIWTIIEENIKWRCHLAGLPLKISKDVAEECITKAKKVLNDDKDKSKPGDV